MIADILTPQLRGAEEHSRRMDRILVIAQDADLRRSLQFALEAEGYAVTVSSSIAVRDPPAEFACTVVDHHALGSNRGAAIAFLETFEPVILLANMSSHTLSPWAYRTVLKPLLGPALTTAIREVIDARAVPT
jgi:hypothetical protein